MHVLFWALLILFLVAAFLQLDWVYYLVYVVGGVWAASHWWVHRTLRRLEVRRHMADRAFPGEQIEVEHRFINRSWLPIPWLYVQAQVPLELKDRQEYRAVLSVGSRSQASYHYTLLCKQRGLYRVGPLVISSGDLFGFTGAGLREADAARVTVYPRVLPLPALGLLSQSPFGGLASRQRIFEDPARLAGVRDYTPGDSLRRVHWKSSAHTDKLLVKKFQPAIALNMMLALNLDRRDYPPRGTAGYIEWAIEVGASLAAYAVEQRQSVGLLSNAKDMLTEQPAGPIPPRPGRGHLMNVLALLARVQAQPAEESFAAWLPRQTTSLVWGATLLVVSPRIDGELVAALSDIHRRGANVIALICAPQADFKLFQTHGERVGLTVLPTAYSAVDLVAALGARR